MIKYKYKWEITSSLKNIVSDKAHTEKCIKAETSSTENKWQSKKWTVNLSPNKKSVDRLPFSNSLNIPILSSTRMLFRYVFLLS